ncbi:hypothetical protein LOTGIDRAFT_112175 [Lottia gigantea]|uniref:Uncharacterized protein n=1 Tax=Lottia gigantea TaxID=225164 RepID=V4B2F5_LOTGI|nr:hypothetical protein LOTGIDRAFT_112175 [Lottia gigantea]ESP00532.1 hypothetical protein LOTGIDRAFT_112175 [Lottia gigantea]
MYKKSGTKSPFWGGSNSSLLLLVDYQLYPSRLTASSSTPRLSALPLEINSPLYNP